MILLVGGEKGGSCKTTTATNLAVVMAQRGVDVMLLDADPQCTASKWVARRNAAELPMIHCAQKTGEVYATANDLAKRYELVIVDAGGRDSKELRSAMVAADLLLMPIQASIADLETIEHMAEVIGMAKAMNSTLEVMAMIARAPTNPSITEVAEARELLADYPEIGLARSIVRDRKIYRDALLEGRGVVEMDNTKARAEIQLLANEIFGER
ncbi:chromosome partitioning protein [Crenobacter luteus]|uniref:AAA family ATPase n=1 Tax=Crenobacter luteus TaxID=1452487 RepID=UPI001043B49A|nr:AAA family ATPase [Crenobacter luteus]TCP10655.1 chromosome partitioning protein [Crenobacter luteus]